MKTCIAHSANAPSPSKRSICFTVDLPSSIEPGPHWGDIANSSVLRKFGIAIGNMYICMYIKSVNTFTCTQTPLHIHRPRPCHHCMLQFSVMYILNKTKLMDRVLFLMYRPPPQPLLAPSLPPHLLSAPNEHPSSPPTRLHTRIPYFLLLFNCKMALFRLHTFSTHTSHKYITHLCIQPASTSSYYKPNVLYFYTRAKHASQLHMHVYINSLLTFACKIRHIK